MFRSSGARRPIPSAAKSKSSASTKAGTGDFTSLLGKGDPKEQVSLASPLGFWDGSGESAKHEDGLYLLAAAWTYDWLGRLSNRPVGLLAGAESLPPSVVASQKTVQTLYKTLSTKLGKDWRENCTASNPVKQRTAGNKLLFPFPSLEFTSYAAMASDVSDVAQMAWLRLEKLRMDSEKKECQESFTQLLEKTFALRGAEAASWAESFTLLTDLKMIMNCAKPDSDSVLSFENIPEAEKYKNRCEELGLSTSPDSDDEDGM